MRRIIEHRYGRYIDNNCACLLGFLLVCLLAKGVIVCTKITTYTVSKRYDTKIESILHVK